MKPDFCKLCISDDFSEASSYCGSEMQHASARGVSVQVRLVTFHSCRYLLRHLQNRIPKVIFLVIKFDTHYHSHKLEIWA